jgi:prepilin signal peptidase PulO-like enzyme (type II secretory pathway)
MIFALQARLFLRAAVFLAAAIPITVIDLRSRRIPDVLSLGALMILVVFDIVSSAPDFFFSTGTGLFAFLVFWAVRALAGGLGFGDVKYAALLGFFTGPRFLPVAFLVAAAGGLVYALAAILFFGKSKDERIAFGPFLSAGGLAAAVCMTARFRGTG